MTFTATSPDLPAMPTRILIVRLSAHGDLIHTLPLLVALKRHNPEAHVGWLVESSAAPLLEGHPLIDQVHVSHRKRWLKLAKNPLQWPRVLGEIGQLLRELRQANYQVSLDVQGLLKSAIWPAWVKIPRRMGFKGTREFADIWYTDKLPYHDFKDTKTPVVERFLDFARALNCPVGQPEFAVPPVKEESRQKITRLLGENSPIDGPLVVVAPFTRWESKHWPAEAWAQLFAELAQLPIRIAILGAPGDEKATSELLAQVPMPHPDSRILNLVGKTDWPDLFALFQQTRLLIGLDSGPLHIANAVGIPEIIGIYGPTAVGRTGPIGTQHTALSTALACQPCHAHVCPLKTHDCMRQLTPAMVIALVRRHLGMPSDSVKSGATQERAV
jgi:heptosyltransferase-1